MPQRPQFDLDAPTLVPVLPTVGVLESPTDKTILVGAYFDSEEEFKGLYLVTPQGIQYMALGADEISIGGLQQASFFAYEGLDYSIRPVVEDDGVWLSDYKIALPFIVLAKMIITQATDTIEKIAGVEASGVIPTFEALYAYYDETLELVVSLVYMSNFGIYARIDGDWKEDDISAPSYQNLMTIEVGSEKADELINLFDSKFGNVSLGEIKPYAVSEVEEEGEQ